MTGYLSWKGLLCVLDDSKERTIKSVLHILGFNKWHNDNDHVEKFYKYNYDIVYLRKLYILFQNTSEGIEKDSVNKIICAI